MTVVVGVLNKKGVAIAADSATTIIENGQVVKIVNSGNKMLRLSDSVDVGVMIVNTAKILGMPWDVIIRWYRKKRGKEEFPTIEKIVEDFLNFVQNLINDDSLPAEWNDSTELVFAGYGQEQDYPTLIHKKINRVSNRKLEVDNDSLQIYTIDNENKSEIQYYGQTDIIASLIGDVRRNELIIKFCRKVSNILHCEKDRIMKLGILEPNTIITMPDYSGKLLSAFDKQYRNREQWLESIKGYSLQEMARLAENLVNATELHRKIMFQQESVGGLIDLAVISKADGFQWLNRKSWYEPSRGGQYGKFGI